MVTKQDVTSGMLRVVIVDDTPAIRSRVRAMVEDVAGVAVVGEAGGVREAWEVVEAAHPDVVILDLRMPDGTGFDVLRAMTRPRREPRVIVLTNEACPVVWRECLTAGAEWCFDKSTEFDRIPGLLSALVADRRDPVGLSKHAGRAGLREARAMERRTVAGQDGIAR